MKKGDSGEARAPVPMPTGKTASGMLLNVALSHWARGDIAEAEAGFNDALEVDRNSARRDKNRELYRHYAEFVQVTVDGHDIEGRGQRYAREVLREKGLDFSSVPKML